MNRNSTAAFAIAAAIAMLAASSGDACASSHHRRHDRHHHRTHHFVDDLSYGYSHQYWPPHLNGVLLEPTRGPGSPEFHPYPRERRCVIDKGYGRYSFCGNR